jgi:menaquinone-9 beta-reductase
METCDVVIVGGGPAGSSCARELCLAGLDVILLDKARFPRDKVCAGWITPAVVDELELNLDDYARTRVLQPITGFRTSLLGASEVTTSFGRPVSYGIRRCEFDDYLLARCGARSRLGTPLADLRRDGDRWIVNEEISSPLLVGAGGHFCPVARFATEKPALDEEAIVLAQEIEFEMNAEQRRACRVEESTPELFFCDDLMGYAWCFRKGDFLNIGLGREGETRLSAQVESFYQWLTERKRIPSGTSPRFHGHAYRLYVGPPRKLRYDRVMLIGDAAGLAYAQSGEGIRPAIESGLLAAAAILETPGACHAELGERLERSLLARFGPRSRRGGWSAAVPLSWRRFAAKRLLASRWFSRRVLIERWFLHADQPPLAAVCSRRLRSRMAS